MSRSAFAATLIVLTPVLVSARIVKITIASRAPAFNGQTFGAAGQFEKIKGIASGEIESARAAAISVARRCGSITKPDGDGYRNQQTIRKMNVDTNGVYT